MQVIKQHVLKFGLLDISGRTEEKTVPELLSNKVLGPLNYIAC